MTTAASGAASSSAIPTPATTLVVNPRQKGNPILKFVRNVAWAYGETPADYMMSESAGGLFLSLRYHQLHPNYLARRLGELLHHFTLRVLLVLVDASEADKPLLEISRQAMRSDFTLLLAWSPQEAARYLETLKAYARKPADMIQGQHDRAFMSQLTEVLTTVRPVNKTDVATLHASFGSLSSVMTASREQLSRCPGLGERKVARLLEAFDEPFIPRGAALPAAAAAAATGGEAE